MVDTEHTFRVEPGERLLSAARRAGVWLPFECGWGSCGTCKVSLVDGEVALLFADAPAVDERDQRRGRTITCQTTPTSDLAIRVRRLGPNEERPTTDHTATLAGVTPLGPEIAAFRFDLGQPAHYRPGQYAILQLAPDLRRCYSMSGLPGASEIELIAKRYPGGAGSNALFALDLGDQVAAELPYGGMWLHPGGERIVLIAGGTGISPILALLRQLVAHQHPGEVEIVFGANSRDELVRWDEITELAAALPRARLHGVLRDAPDSWSGGRGLAPDHLRGLVSGDERCYLAGPPPMVDATLHTLKEGGVSLARIHYDRFG